MILVRVWILSSSVWRKCLFSFGLEQLSNKKKKKDQLYYLFLFFVGGGEGRDSMSAVAANMKNLCVDLEHVDM